MADLVDTLKGYSDKAVGAAKAVVGGADKLGTAVGMVPAPDPMPGRLPLGEIPKVIPKVNTNTGDFSKKKF